MGRVSRLKGRLLAGPLGRHLLAVLVLAFFTMSFDLGRFAHFTYDDYALIVLNESIRDFSGISEVLGSGRPVRGLTLMLDHALWGMDPLGYHLSNFAWHFACLLSLYFLCCRLMKRHLPAAVAACFFALHAAHSEAVMAVSHRKEMLAFLFMLLAYHCYLCRRSRPYSSLIFGAVFFLLGILSKQVALVLPLLLLAHEWLLSSKGISRRGLVWLAPLLIGGAGLLIAGAAISLPVLRDFDIFGLVRADELADIGYSKILATSLATYPRHIRTMLFPVHLNLDPMIEITSFTDPRAWFGLFCFAALNASIWFLRRDRLVAYSLAWVSINLLPVMNLVPSNYFFAERYLYIPSTGFCMLAATLWTRVYDHEGEIMAPGAYRVASALLLFSLFALILVVTPAHRARALWDLGGAVFMGRARAIAIASVSAAFGAALIYKLVEGWKGKALLEKWWLELPLAYLLVVAAGFSVAVIVEYLMHHRLGLPRIDITAAWDRTRDFISEHAEPGPRLGGSRMLPSFSPRAELINLLLWAPLVPTLVVFFSGRFFRKLRSVSPTKALAAELLLVMLLAHGQQLGLRNGTWTSEIRLWSATLMDSPRSINAWNNLAKAYVDRGRFDLALDAYRKALELGPENADSRLNYAMALVKVNDYRQAREQFERVLDSDPDNIGANYLMGNILNELATRERDPDLPKKAVSHYLAVLKAEPANDRAYHGLAYSYLLLGDFDQALHYIDRAMAIRPTEQRENLKRKILDLRRMRR